MPKTHVIVPTFGKAAKGLVALLCEQGFEVDRVNSKGMVYFRHDTLPEQRVNPRMSDTTAANEIRRFQRLVGMPTKGDLSKRDSATVSARRAKEREQAAAEHARLSEERDRLVAEKEAFAARFGVDTVAEANALVAQIERTEAQMRYWRDLMVETPDTGHRGVEHAKHRA